MTPGIQSHKLRTAKRYKPTCIKKSGQDADGAKQFTHRSPKSAAKVAAYTARNGCACNAYSDVFTLKRWNAQDMAVCSEAKFLKLPLYGSPKSVDPRLEDKYVPSVIIIGIIKVYCRCQVRKIDMTSLYSGVYHGPTVSPEALHAQPQDHGLEALDHGPTVSPQSYPASWD